MQKAPFPEAEPFLMFCLQFCTESVQYLLYVINKYAFFVYKYANSKKG